MDIFPGCSGITKNEGDAQLGQLREPARRYCHSFYVSARWFKERQVVLLTLAWV